MAAVADQAVALTVVATQPGGEKFADKQIALNPRLQGEPDPEELLVLPNNVGRE